MAVLSNDLIRQGAAGASTGYTIKNSIRFNSGDNPKLGKTFSGAGTEETWTFSCWIKLGVVTSNGRRQLFSAGSGGSDFCGAELGSTGDSSMEFFNYKSGSYDWRLRTTQQFRDVAAWYHFVFVSDTTNSITNQRARMYVNGERITDFATASYPSANYASNYWMGTTEHEIGTSIFTTQNFDGYMAEINNIDGYAYGPEYFGQIQEDTNIWVPIKYGSSYGTNGFYIKGSNSGSLGADSSGNGNNFTTSGLAANDQKIDTPTNNQITFNPLNNQRSGGTPSNGNLEYEGPGTRTVISLTANIPPTGKWAIAFKVAAVSTNNGWQFGVTKSTNSNFGDAAGSNEDVGGQDNDGINMSPSSSDLTIYDYVNSTSIDPSLPITTSDEFWIAVDMATGKVFLGIYDESATTMKFVAADTGLDGNPATGDNPTTTLSDMIGSNEYTFAVGSKDTSNDIYLQRSTDVSGTTPSGYTYFQNVKDLL